MSELKPCPLCGSKKITLIEGGLTKFGYKPDCFCRDCGCKATQEAWNNRPSPWVSEDVQGLAVQQTLFEIAYFTSSKVLKLEMNATSLAVAEFALRALESLPQPPKEIGTTSGHLNPSQVNAMKKELDLLDKKKEQS